MNTILIIIILALAAFEIYFRMIDHMAMRRIRSKYEDLEMKFLDYHKQEYADRTRDVNAMRERLDKLDRKVFLLSRHTGLTFTYRAAPLEAASFEEIGVLKVSTLTDRLYVVEDKIETAYRDMAGISRMLNDIADKTIRKRTRKGK